MFLGKKIKLILLIFLSLLLFSTSLVFLEKKFQRSGKFVEINSETKEKVFEENLSINEEIQGEKNCFSQPLENFSERITKKSFGIYVTPQNSPVEPEIFSGFHAGTDFEISEDERDEAVEIRAICEGKVRFKGSVGGYGGVLIESCEYEGKKISVLYGHLSLSSISKKLNDPVSEGEMLASLGDPQKGETSGERKHLHLGIYFGDKINFLGYVKNQSDLSSWIDFEKNVCR